MRHANRLFAVALAVLVLTSGAIGVVGTVTAQAETTTDSFHVSVTDATGHTVTLDHAPERVVTLAPSAAQTMFEIGAQDKVVATSDRASYLDWNEQKAIISSEQGFVNTEKVINQTPDLVLAPDIIGDDTVKQLRNAGLTVYNFDRATSMADVVEKTRLTGRLTDSVEGANDRADEMEQSLEIVRTAVEGEDRPSALYLLGGKFTAGNDTFINSVIETAGGTNIAAKHFSGYAMISDEVVANESPEYILVSNEAPGVIPKTQAYNSTTAVQNDQIIRINANYLNQPAPRTVQVVEDLASEWHPQSYESAKESYAHKSTTNNTVATAMTTETQSPGFGPILGLLAIVGAALVSRVL